MTPKKSKGKYGRIYVRSGFEDRVKQDLEDRGVSYKYEDPDSYLYYQSYYKPDFTLDNGVLVETKGYLDA